MIPDVVRAMRPGHEDPELHDIKAMDQGIVYSGPTWWSCSCGAIGTLTSLDIRAALEGNLVSRT